MAETRELWMRFFGDTKSLDSANKRAAGGLGKVDKKVSGTTRALGGLNKALVGAGLAIGAMEIARWANDAAKMADAAEIAAQSIEKSLGPAAQQFRDDLEENRKILGLNRLEVDQLGASMGLLFTGMGVGQEAAAGYASSLVEIAGDLAAFRGDLSLTDEALAAINSALKGQNDPLEAFGVKLSKAKVDAEILRLEALDPLFATLSDGEKQVLAISSLIEREAAPAMGALEDAADSTAAKTNELAVETEDLQTELGAVVNEIKGPLASALTVILRGFIDANKAIGRFIGGNAARLVHVWIPAAQEAFREFAEKVVGAFAVVKGAIEAIFSPIRKATDLVGGLIRRIGNIKLPSIKIPGFATGGVVPGPRGAPTLAMVHGGETVTTANGTQRGDAGGGSGGPMIGTLIVEAGISSPDETARAIVDLLTQYNRNQGSIPITISEGIGT